MRANDYSPLPDKLRQASYCFDRVDCSFSLDLWNVLKSLDMYKNRSRGLKRVASVLGSASASSSNLGEDKASSSRPPNQQRSPLKEAKHHNVADEEEDSDDVRPPPTKKPHIPSPEVEKKTVKSARVEAKSQPKSKPKADSAPAPKPKPSRPSRDRSTKPSLLSNCVDIDVNTLYAVFPSKFEELVAKSGLKLRDGDEPFLLSKTHSHQSFLSLILEYWLLTYNVYLFSLRQRPSSVCAQLVYFII